MSGKKRTGTETAFLQMLVALIVESVQPNIERTLEVKMNELWNKVMQIINPITARLDALWEKADDMFDRLDDVQNTAVEAVTTTVTHEQLQEALNELNIEKEIYNSISELDEKMNNIKSELDDFVTQQGTHTQLMDKVKEAWNEFIL